MRFYDVIKLNLLFLFNWAVSVFGNPMVFFSPSGIKWSHNLHSSAHDDIVIVINHLVTATNSYSRV